MKRFFTILATLIVLCSSFLPAYATEQTETLLFTETALEGGITVVDEITVYSSSRSADKLAERKKTFYRDDVVIAVIAFQAIFHYDGSSVSVVSKSVTQTDTYSGWSYKQESFTSSGGTVTLTGKLKYLLIFSSTTFTMNLICDANGNISY